MPTRSIRDVSLFVEVVGHGYPLLLMHGGPGADHWTMRPFRRCSDRFTLVFYDHRCNGRSTGAPVTSMTWENLTADADALRQSLGFEKWAVLGHSFGGHVALEYALRYPERVSHLVLLDTGGDSRWSLTNAADLLAKRGYSLETVKLARRWFNGEVEPSRFLPTLLRLGKAYDPYLSLRQLLPPIVRAHGARSCGRRRSPSLAATSCRDGRSWTGSRESTAPTLVIAGRDDFVFPPEHQAQLAGGIPDARLVVIERRGRTRSPRGPTRSWRPSGTSFRSTRASPWPRRRCTIRDRGSRSCSPPSGVTAATMSSVDSHG